MMSQDKKKNNFSYLGFFKTISVLFIFLTLVLIITIITFSLTPATKSAQQTENVAKIVSPEKYYETVNQSNGQQNFLNSGYYLTFRKLFGHYGMFSLLGLSLFISVYLLLKPRKFAPIITLFSGFFIACVSELLQFPVFATGRHPSWKDVGIDTGGIVTGILIGLILIFLIKTLLQKINIKKYATIEYYLNYFTYKQLMTDNSF